MARCAMGVVRVAETPRRLWPFQIQSNHPAAACRRCFPSLSKERSPIFRVSQQKLTKDFSP